eukprot:3531140-Rhodomonas_salina.1
MRPAVSCAFAHSHALNRVLSTSMVASCVYPRPSGLLAYHSSAGGGLLPAIPVAGRINSNSWRPHNVRRTGTVASRYASLLFLQQPFIGLDTVMCSCDAGA